MIASCSSSSSSSSSWRSIGREMEEAKACRVKNVCIVAHVDHGKTTMADCLLSSNAIISGILLVHYYSSVSGRMVGKMRYLDSREDEQERGITLKASSVCLRFADALIHLVDSPGHLDFAVEVRSAMLLSDIAILVVDVAEGVCSQTEMVLRAALHSGLEILLVLNKLDRLHGELGKTPGHVFVSLRQLIERLNSLVAMHSAAENTEIEWEEVERREKHRYFSPEMGNVIFASASQSWAFVLNDFARLWAEKLAIPVDLLCQSLFADSYLHGKTIREGAAQNQRKTLFEQLIIEPIWQVLDAKDSLERLAEMNTRLGLPPLRSRRPIEAQIELLNKWIPLPKTLLNAVSQMRSADLAFANRRRLDFVATNSTMQRLLANCDDSSDDCVVFMAKQLSLGGIRMGMSRVLSGTLRPEMRLNVCGQESRLVRVISLFCLMGRDAVQVAMVRAGHICGVQIDDATLRTATLSTLTGLPSLIDTSDTCEPLMRVSVETSSRQEMDHLRTALRELTMLDSSVRVFEQENGELALLTAGEVHLQKCLRDLADQGMVDLSVSDPVIPFLETIVPPARLDQLNEHIDLDTNLDYSVENATRNGEIILRLRALPMPLSLLAELQRNVLAIRALRERRHAAESLIEELKRRLMGVFDDLSKSSSSDPFWKQTSAEHLVECIWAVGPSRARFNLLFNCSDEKEDDGRSVWSGIGFRGFDQALITGFDLACVEGPLCKEPMIGVCLLVEQFRQSSSDSASDATMAGSVISLVRDTAQMAIGKCSIRLMVAMYLCSIQTSQSGLGKAHVVLAQRKAKVLKEEWNELTGLFHISATLAMVESFGFCDQLRTRTSGMAHGQLTFSHWQILDDDPFWEPSTEQEKTLWGDKADCVSLARLYVDAVRRRKGLLTDRPIVMAAEKQRTLKRNK